MVVSQKPHFPVQTFCLFKEMLYLCGGSQRVLVFQTVFRSNWGDRDIPSSYWCLRKGQNQCPRFRVLVLNIHRILSADDVNGILLFYILSSSRTLIRRLSKRLSVRMHSEKGT